MRDDGGRDRMGFMVCERGKRESSMCSPYLPMSTVFNVILVGAVCLQAALFFLIFFFFGSFRRSRRRFTGKPDRLGQTDQFIPDQGVYLIENTSFISTYRYFVPSSLNQKK
jgi:hypothetical protein